MTHLATETPRILLTSVSNYIAQFKYTEFDLKTLIEKDMVCTEITEYKPEDRLLSEISPSTDVLALYLALIFAKDHGAEELCTILRMIIKRDQDIDAKHFPRNSEWKMWETILVLFEGKLVYGRTKKA